MKTDVNIFNATRSSGSSVEMIKFKCKPIFGQIEQYDHIICDMPIFLYFRKIIFFSNFLYD